MAEGGKMVWAPGRISGRRARIRECHRNRGLAAESDHPVLQRGRDRPRNPTSLATVSNQPVVKPMRANPQTRCRIGRLNRMIKRRYSCFSDPGRGSPSDCGSPQASIPAPTAVQFALARIAYVTASATFWVDEKAGKRSKERKETVRLPHSLISS